HAQQADAGEATEARARPLSQRNLDKTVIDHGANGDEATDEETADAATGDRVRETLRKDTLPRVFGHPLADAGSMREAVERAYEDPSVNPKRTVTTWEPRDRDEEKEDDEDDVLEDSPLLEGIGKIIGLIGAYGLWVLLGVLAVILLATSPRWIVWLRSAVDAQRREPEPVARDPLAEVAPLPDDIPTAIRRLWAEGRQREALALLYRASIETMTARTGVVLVPGATEAACLRASRKMPVAADRDAFAAAVRLWQYAAYAGRLPDDAAFQHQLDTLAERFGWTGAGAPDATPEGAGA
ncbi:DUF4129 domain-containing protein, partial [Lysobacter maris]